MHATAGRQGLRAHGRIIGVLAALAAFATAWSMAAASPAADAAFSRFWDARDAAEASRAVESVVQSGISFEDAVARLKAGRAYSANVPRGVVRLSHKVGGTEFFYDLNVPESYDPSRRYQVRFQLHGGVHGRDTNQPRGGGAIGALAGAEQIYVIPYSWTEAPWWGDAQLDNLRGILDRLKRTYNVDENHVALAGVSDGGTAAYYFAMRDTTPYASFLPLNGYLNVLRNPSVGGANVLFPNNIRNKPLFVVNGGQDPLYPAEIVEPSLERLKEGGVTIEYHPQPTAGHNTRWWPEVKDLFETFVREHPRSPHPATLTWEASGAERGNRAHWLVIDRVTSSRDAPLTPDLNRLARPTLPAYAGRTQPALELFAHERPHGRVDLVRTGNTVEVATRGVAEFTVLLSPGVFDFSQRVKVASSGRVLFEGRVKPSVAALMKWAARDNDRTMLFGAELHIKVGP